jgi:hypothetical protein
MEPRSAMLARFSLLSVCALLLAASGSASTVETATSGAVSYQFDGGSHHDAPDACPEAAPAWALPVDGQADGLLVAPDDVADAYTMEVPRSLVGTRLSLAVAEPTGAQELRIDAFAPGCMGSILDLVNWPQPEPSPPAPAAGEEQVAAASLTPEHCDSRKWVFLLDGLDGLPAPATIHVAWTDGSEGPVHLWQASPQFAVYPTAENLGITLKGAWANLPAAFEGSLRVIVGPCDAFDGGAVYGGPPTLADGLLSFTPTRAGTHVVLVDLAGTPAVPAPVTLSLDSHVPVAPEEVVGSADGTLGVQLRGSPSVSLDPSSPSVRVPGIYAPMTCHYCLGGAEDVVEKISYRLSASRAS